MKFPPPGAPPTRPNAERAHLHPRSESSAVARSRQRGESLQARPPTTPPSPAAQPLGRARGGQEPPRGSHYPPARAARRRPRSAARSGTARPSARSAPAALAPPPPPLRAEGDVTPRGGLRSLRRGGSPSRARAAGAGAVRHCGGRAAEAAARGSRRPLSA